MDTINNNNTLKIINKFAKNSYNCTSDELRVITRSILLLVNQLSLQLILYLRMYVISFLRSPQNLIVRRICFNICLY